MDWLCKYCGSHRVKTVVGESEDALDRLPERLICAECGKTLSDDPAVMEKLYREVLREIEDSEPFSGNASGMKQYVRLHIHSEACGIEREGMLEVPFGDGTYSLSDKEYPLCCFSPFVICGENVSIGKDKAKLGRHKLGAVKNYTAYGPDRVAWPETVTITIERIWKNPEEENRI